MTWKEFKDAVDSFLASNQLEDSTDIIFIELLCNPTIEKPSIFYDFADHGLEISNQKTEF